MVLLCFSSVSTCVIARAKTMRMFISKGLSLNCLKMGMLEFYVLPTNSLVIWNCSSGKNQLRKKSWSSSWNCFEHSIIQHKKTGLLSGFFMLKTPNLKFLTIEAINTLPGIYIGVWCLSVSQRYNLKANHNRNDDSIS